MFLPHVEHGRDPIREHAVRPIAATAGLGEAAEEVGRDYDGRRLESRLLGRGASDSSLDRALEARVRSSQHISAPFRVTKH